MKQPPAHILKAWQDLDAADCLLPEGIELVQEDDELFPNSYAELADEFSNYNPNTQQALIDFTVELMAMEDRRLYDFAILRGLTLEIGAELECHYITATEQDDEFEPEVGYAIALPKGRWSDIVNSLAHEAGHNLDALHIPKGKGFKEYAVHSGNPIFQQCCAIDAALHPDGLGQKINAMLLERNYSPEALLANGLDADDVQARMESERFAILCELKVSPQVELPASPLLDAYYHQFVDLDLAIGTRALHDSAVRTERLGLAKTLLAPITNPQFHRTTAKLDEEAPGAFAQKQLNAELLKAESFLMEEMESRYGLLHADLEVNPKALTQSAKIPALSSSARGRA